MGAFGSKGKPKLSTEERACVWSFTALVIAAALATITVLWYSVANPRQLNPCQALACLNGGTCRATSQYTAVCVCAYGFLGDRCAVAGCAGQGPPGAEPQQTLWNQTVLPGAVATGLTWIAPFMDGGAAQKLWLVYADTVILYDGGAASTPITTGGRNNTWGLVCDQHSVFIGRGPCVGPQQPCILQVYQNGSVVPYAYSGDFVAIPAGTTVTVKSMNCALDFVFTAGTVTRWRTVADGVRDISAAVAANDSVVAAAGTVFASNGTVLTYVYGVGDGIASGTVLQVANSDPFPAATDVAVVGIISLSATESGTVWVTVKYLNWTAFGVGGTAAPASASFSLYHFGSRAQSLVTTGSYLPLVSGSLQVYGSVSGDLFLTDGNFVARQTCNGAAPATCPDCGEAAICQGLTCQCSYPYFNGSFPSCTDVNECASGRLVGTSDANGNSACGASVSPPISRRGLFCVNYSGGRGCYTSGATLQSWLAASYSLYAVQPYPNSYSSMSFSPASSRTRFSCRLFLDSSELVSTFVTTEIFGSPDDRDLIMFIVSTTNDYTVFMSPSFHISNPNLAYTNCGFSSGEGMCMIDVTTGGIIDFLQYDSMTPCGGIMYFSFQTCDMIQPDREGTVWAICGIYTAGSLPTRHLWILRFNATLSGGLVGPCVDTGEVPFGISDYCIKSEFVIVPNCFSRPYSPLPIHGVNSQGLPSASGSSQSIFLNYTVPSNPIVTGTGPFAGTSPFGLPGYFVMSTSSRDDGSTVNVVWTTTDTPWLLQWLLIADSELRIVRLFQIYPAIWQNPWAAYADPTGGCAVLNPQNMYSSGSTLSLSAFMYFPDISAFGPCSVSNGNCGGQYCVQTTTASVARCDVCNRLAYPQSAAAIAAEVSSGFKPVRIYSDPFLRGPTAAAQALFLAGTAPVLYRVQLQPTASPAMTFTNVNIAFPPFGFAMAQESHESLIYVIAKRYTTGLPDTRVVACVNFMRTFVVRTLNASRLNFTGAVTPVTYDIRATTFDRTNVLWLIACTSTSCYMSKWYGNLTLIASAVLPVDAAAYRLSTFIYDRKTLVFTAGGTEPLFYRYIGGADYAKQYWSDVLIGPDSIDLSVVGGGGNFTVVDSTQFGYIGLVTPVTYQSSVWTSLQVYDPFGQIWQTVPLVMNIQNGHVVNTDQIVQIHFSGWGSLYYVTASGYLGVVTCAAGSPDF